MAHKLKIERLDHVLVLTVNDPETCNALNGDEMFAAFEAAVLLANTDLEIRAVGYSRAAEMAFTGDSVTAQQAAAVGLVSKVVPHAELMAAALDLAGRISRNPPQVLRWTKRLLKESQHERLDTILGMAAAYQAIAHHTEDHLEAVSALLEKRNPEFKGR